MSIRIEDRGEGAWIPGVNEPGQAAPNISRFRFLTQIFQRWDLPVSMKNVIKKVAVIGTTLIIAMSLFKYLLLFFPKPFSDWTTIHPKYL